MKKFTQFSRGFTLIELLVVIAIIGILSSIVLASLSSARNRGKDAAVQEALAGARAQAEIYNASSSTYANICLQTTSQGGIATILAGAASTMGATTTGGYGVTATASIVACVSNASTWAAIAPLTTSGTFWCVDNTGASKQEAVGTTTGAGVCQ